MIGILAGMGPRSTAPFLDAVVSKCQEIYGAKADIDFPRMMILSLPTPFYLDQPIDHEAMKTSITEGLKQLEATGVNFIAMPCNSAHMYYNDLAKNISTPLLNIVDVTLATLNPTLKTTLLATSFTFDSQLYQAGFSGKEIDFYFNAAWQSKINEVILSVKAGKIVPQAVNIFQDLFGELENNGIDQVVLACTDFSPVLPYIKTDIEIVDSAEALATETVKRFLQNRKTDK